MKKKEIKKSKVRYLAVNPNGKVEWDNMTELMGTKDQAIANLLSCITWMDKW